MFFADTGAPLGGGVLPGGEKAGEWTWNRRGHLALSGWKGREQAALAGINAYQMIKERPHVLP